MKYSINYGALSRIAYKDASKLLVNPEKVASSKYLVWLSALYTWMTP